MCQPCGWTHSRVGVIILQSQVERGHGRWRVASQPRPRPIRGEFPRQQDRCGRAAAADGGRPQGPRGLRGRRPAQASRCDRRPVRRNAFCERGSFPTQAQAGAGFSDIGGAAPDHGDVLRSRRLNEPRGEARRGGLAQPRQRLSRRSLRRRDGAWRPCAEKTRRRADGALRLPDGPSSPRASASTPALSWSTRPARCSARRRTSPRASRPSPNRERFS
jgi:hypothetical protein